MPWYSFTPLGSFPYDVSDPNNYTLVGTNPPICPSPNLHLCAIQVPDNGGKPNFGAAPGIAFQIANALNNNLDTTNVLLRPNLI
ncbi:hypothetical protein [Sphingobacterium sp. UBA6320]|uniref:hypothetical protein n=1 Tax=Sphingobacterium sp. UBA6320 TaxID=1947510 RepID=UPI0025F2A872|nr:hypothetical protein [Sphingobacterium sp. UBA6320]